MTLSRRDAVSLLSLGGLATLTVGSGHAWAEGKKGKVKFNFKPDLWTGRKRYTGKKTVPYHSSHKRGTIIIATDERKLYYILGGGKAIEYGVGVGRQGFSWQGTAKIRRKAKWPDWHPPKEMIERVKEKYGQILPDFVEGGPENPLGARALYLYKGGRDTLYRIHGTSQPHTIGLAVSSGCIRMLNDEVIDLFKRVKIGTKVIVI